MEILTFGKYKGRKTEDVININPFYIKWCIDNVAFFHLPEHLQNKYKTALIEEQDRRDCDEMDYFSHSDASWFI